MGIEKEVISEKTNKIIHWIKKQVLDAGKKGTVFGLSGGIDSAVIAAMCKQAFPEENMALILPCESNLSDIKDALQIVDKFQIKYNNIDLTDIYKDLLKVMRLDSHKMAKANIKPRLRMIVLYYFANHFDYLVVGTGNKSELAIGYFTKYGDGGSDILPLGNSYKTEVKAMAKYLTIPEEIINKPPSAGLWKNQTDEKEMGFSYDILDRYLATGEIVNQRIEKNILRMKQASEHKRNTPPIPHY
jgi:NAD+ synthase